MASRTTKKKSARRLKRPDRSARRSRRFVRGAKVGRASADCPVDPEGCGWCFEDEGLEDWSE